VPGTTELKRFRGSAYVAANPGNADGQFTPAMAYEAIACNIKLTEDPAAPARIAYLEKAADR
jgi:hypothetical protein